MRGIIGLAPAWTRGVACKEVAASPACVRKGGVLLRKAMRRYRVRDRDGGCYTGIIGARCHRAGNGRAGRFGSVKASLRDNIAVTVEATYRTPLKDFADIGELSLLAGISVFLF